MTPSSIPHRLRLLKPEIGDLFSSVPCIEYLNIKWSQTFAASCGFVQISAAILALGFFYLFSHCLLDGMDGSVM